MSSASKIGWQKLSHTEITGVQGIMQESSTQNFPLGYKLELEDGRIFRYCKAGAVALVAGCMSGSPLVATERDDTVNGAVAISVGATSFTQTAVGTITANQFQDGMACFVDDTGEGLQYKIKSNTAAAAAAETTVTLYDPIVTATGTTTSCILVVSPYTGLIITPDDVIKAMGVPTIPVTALYYFWSQTGGLATVLQGSSTGVATDERVLRMDVAAAVDGAVDSATGTLAGTETVGHHIFDSTDCVDTEYWPVWLSID
jgi:hypothetical protein